MRIEITNFAHVEKCSLDEAKKKNVHHPLCSRKDSQNIVSSIFAVDGCLLFSKSDGN
jgi:hypothetical protein